MTSLDWFVWVGLSEEVKFESFMPQEGLGTEVAFQTPGIATVDVLLQKTEGRDDGETERKPP